MRRRYRAFGLAHLNDISGVHLQGLRLRICTSRAHVTSTALKLSAQITAVYAAATIVGPTMVALG